jgi:hypothetical protein
MDTAIIVVLIFFAFMAGMVELVERVGGLEDEIIVSKITDERKGD